MSFIRSFLITSIIATNAYSACISYRFRPLLWSPKGDSVIILKQGAGTDGGGSVDLFITSSNMELSQFKVSSTVRPDGSTTSETVSKKDCIASLKEFNLTMASHGFINFLHESTCKEERDYLFNKKVDTTSPVDAEKQTKILKQLEFTQEASAYSSNLKNYVIAQSKSSCTAECFWVLHDPAKDQYTKKGACLPAQ